MFPKQLDAMKSGHEKFMKELDDRLNNWKCEGVLGDIFTRFGNSYHVSLAYICVIVCSFVWLLVLLLICVKTVFMYTFSFSCRLTS